MWINICFLIVWLTVGFAGAYLSQHYSDKDGHTVASFVIYVALGPISLFVAIIDLPFWSKKIKL